MRAKMPFDLMTKGKSPYYAEFASRDGTVEGTFFNLKMVHGPHTDDMWLVRVKNKLSGETGQFRCNDRDECVQVSQDKVALFWTGEKSDEVHEALGRIKARHARQEELLNSLMPALQAKGYGSNRVTVRVDALIALIKRRRELLKQLQDSIEQDESARKQGSVEEERSIEVRRAAPG